MSGVVAPAHLSTRSEWPFVSAWIHPGRDQDPTGSGFPTPPSNFANLGDFGSGSDRIEWTHRSKPTFRDKFFCVKILGNWSEKTFAENNWADAEVTDKRLKFCWVVKKSPQKKNEKNLYHAISRRWQEQQAHAAEGLDANPSNSVDWS